MVCLVILINLKPSLLTKEEQTTQMKGFKLATKIFSICKPTANQLNALVRLKTFLGSNEREVLVNSFVLSNFNYCLLVWFVSSSTSLGKIESLHERALRFLLNDYVSSCEQLLQKSSKASINLRNHRVLCKNVLKQWLI